MMVIGLRPQLKMKVRKMIKKFGLMLLVLCSLSIMSSDADAHHRRRRPSDIRYHHYHLNNLNYYNPYRRPRFIRPYSFDDYNYYRPRRRRAEFYLRFNDGCVLPGRGGFGIGIRW